MRFLQRLVIRFFIFILILSSFSSISMMLQPESLNNNGDFLTGLTTFLFIVLIILWLRRRLRKLSDKPQQPINYTGTTNTSYTTNTLNNYQAPPPPHFQGMTQEQKWEAAFRASNQRAIQEMEQTIYKQVSKALEDSYPIKQLKACYLAIDAFEEARSYCYSKGMGGQLYFKHTWSYTNPSDGKNSEYIDQVHAIRKQLEGNLGD